MQTRAGFIVAGTGVVGTGAELQELQLELLAKVLVWQEELELLAKVLVWQELELELELLSLELVSLALEWDCSN